MLARCTLLSALIWVSFSQAVHAQENTPIRRVGMGQGFGKSVLLLEDLNGDGHAEIAVGIPRAQDQDGIDEVLVGMYDHSRHGAIWEGRLQLLSGKTGKVLWSMDEWDLKPQPNEPTPMKMLSPFPNGKGESGSVESRPN